MRLLSSSNSVEIHCMLAARRMIQMKSMATPWKAVDEVAASARGKVRDTPVPPAIERMLANSGPLFADESSKGAPYGPHKITGVVDILLPLTSLAITSDPSFSTNVFNRLVSPFRHLTMYV